MPLYCPRSLLLDAVVIKFTVLFPKTHYSSMMPSAVLDIYAVYDCFISNLQGKVNKHTPTVRLISVLSMKRNVWIPVKRRSSISGIMWFLSCVAMATWNLATQNRSAHKVLDIEQQMTKCGSNHTKIICAYCKRRKNENRYDESLKSYHRTCCAE